MALSVSVFATLDSRITGISSAGDVAGEVTDASGQHGFVIHDGTVTILDVPGAQLTVVSAAGPGGAAGGYYVDGAGVRHGFTYAGHTFTTIDVPDGDPGTTMVTALGPDSLVAGVYRIGASEHGFVAKDGVVTSFDAPGGVTHPTAFDATGRLLGTDFQGQTFVYDGNTVTVPLGGGVLYDGWHPFYGISGGIGGFVGNHGFVESAGMAIQLDVPGANVTVVNATNGNGDAGGYWIGYAYDSIGYGYHGFVWTKADGYRVIDFPGASAMDVTAVGKNGEVAGIWVDADGVYHNFVEWKGVYASFDAPGASVGVPLVIDDQGHIVGESVTGYSGVAVLTFLASTLGLMPPEVVAGLVDDTGSSSSDGITTDAALTGTGDANAVVHFTVDGQAIAMTVQADGSGKWSFTPIGLADGTHTVTASETDAANNTASASVSFMLDSAAPDTTIVVKPAAVTVQSTATFSWSGADGASGSGVDHYLYRTDNGNWVSTSATSLSLSGLTAGSHTLQVEGVDRAGNIDNTPASYDWIVDSLSIAPIATSIVSASQKVVIGTVAVGIAGATLSLTQTAGTGKVSLQLVNGIEQVIYTAPTVVSSGVTDSLAYTIADQYGASAVGSGNVLLASAGSAVYSAPAGGTVTVGNSASTINATAGNVKVTAGNGSVVVFAGNNDVITLGNGSDTVVGGSNVTVKLGNGGSTVNVGSSSTLTLGNGNNVVTAGDGSKIILGNGSNTIVAGANSTITVGNGGDTIFAAKGDTVILSQGADTIVFGLSPGQTTAGLLGPVTIDQFTVKKAVIKVASTLAAWDSSFSQLASHIRDDAQGNAVITLDAAGDTVKLVGVHAASLHASNFQFV